MGEALEILKSCDAFLEGHYAAALEMRCGNNGNRFPGGIDAVAVACLVNQGKTFLDEPFRLVGDIQINAHAARPLHFRIYGAGGDGARGQGFAAARCAT